MRTLSCGILALVSACAGDPSTQPTTDEDYANVASSIGAATAHDGGEIIAMRQAVALIRDDHAAGFTPSGDGRFDGAMLGVAYHYDIACLDAGGEHVAPCDRSSNGASVDATWSGVAEFPDLALAVEHDARWQLTRMVGSIAHVDGTGHVDYETRSFGSIAHYAYDATYHLVINDRRAIGGDIHFDVTARHATRDPQPFTLSADLTFSPDDTALLILDSTRHYQIALATGAVTPLPTE